jgi:hypothetical protein
MADEEAIAEDEAAEDSATAGAASAEAGSAEADDSAAGAGFLQALRPKAATALSASTRVRDFFIEFSSEGLRASRTSPTHGSVTANTYHVAAGDQVFARRS